MEESLEFKDIYINLLFAMGYHPHNTTMTIKTRPQHTFLYIVEGEYEYYFEKQSFTAEANNVIYIPKGAVYSYKIISEKAYCYQVEFDINNNALLIDPHPQKVNSFKGIKEHFKTIIDLYNAKNPLDYFEAQSSLYKLCTLIPIKQENQKESFSKIQPALDYIEAHYKDKFNIKLLSELCFISESQLRRYFQKEYKMSPIAYKNRLRIEKAKSMLLYNVADIGETAERLGFDSIYAFSKMFKMYAGLPPSQFAKNKNQPK